MWAHCCSKYLLCFLFLTEFLSLGNEYSYSVVIRIITLDGLLCPAVLEVTKSMQVALGQHYMKKLALQWGYL